MSTTSKGYYRLTKNDSVVQPYHWVLVAPNHEVILVSENYSSKQMALKGVASVRVNCPYDKNYERKQARDGSHMFNLLAQNGEVIGRSEMYVSKQGRDTGIEAVKRYGVDAEVHDETGEGIDENHIKPIVAPQKLWISN